MDQHRIRRLLINHKNVEYRKKKKRSHNNTRVQFSLSHILDLLLWKSNYLIICSSKVHDISCNEVIAQSLKALKSRMLIPLSFADSN